METESMVHVFLVSFPGQGHVNPLLRLGKRLASKGLLVTFCTPESWAKHLTKSGNIAADEPTPLGCGFIRFESFEDGWDPKPQDPDQYLARLETSGRQLLPHMINIHAQLKRPVSCLISNPFIPWVSDVAESLGLPSAILWVQSCASFSAYYHYYHKLVPFPSDTEPEIDVELPFMPTLRYDEVPSFLHPTTPYTFLRNAIMGQFGNLEKPFCVLMDTFQELEHDNIESMSKVFPIKTVGPLFKNLEVANSNSSTVRGDLLKADDCIEWLSSKPSSSVVYVSFGTVVHLLQEQINEIAYGILDSGVSFLWVMKPPHEASGFVPHVLPQGLLEKAGEKGKVVQYSPQEEVLAHPSVACFVTHCGWNSSVEALASGIPLVAFPQWSDQVTNAKYLVDVFRVAVRMCRGEAANELIKRDEVKRCLLEATEGPKAEEIRQNALKYKVAAEAAAAEGGSSDRNIQEFVDEVRKRSIEIKNKSSNSVEGSVNGPASINGDEGFASREAQW
ncbi:hypothetical protein L6164_032064 [Bauhinia variegata]|uniref:Uncharacterized protein n=1 Tax=Bauhinia variegata TaxID=167791 RepID=A0ACB9KMN0_BAUVA|nr:hypothetical protein L6164_032064 [Bauhinia variegata]